MTTTLSSKGQVVLPGPIRARLGLQPGEILEVTLDGDKVVLARRQVLPAKPRQGIDPVSGLPVLSARRKASPLTNDQVAELLSDFP